MSPLEIVQIPVLSDNYVYLIHDEASGQTAVVDPAVAPPVLAELARRGWTLTHILCTHHHDDHVGGVAALKAETGATALGGKGDASRIPGLDRLVGEGDWVDIGAHRFLVLDTPGHTTAHVCYWCAESKALFCGDTLFALGCGRLFGGTPEQMYRSLSRLAALPPETRAFCAHEYTQSNGRFAHSVDAYNPALDAILVEVAQLRARNLPTVPSTIAAEVSANPFMRARDAAHFAELRRLKDSFR